MALATTRPPRSAKGIEGDGLAQACFGLLAVGGAHVNVQLGQVRFLLELRAFFGSDDTHGPVGKAHPAAGQGHEIDTADGLGAQETRSRRCS
jgi:hypothetical protein